MPSSIDSAPRPVRQLLKRELERFPDTPLYDVCHRIEDLLDRRTYHAVLRWADVTIAEGRGA